MSFLAILDLLWDVFFFLGYFMPSNTFEKKLSPQEEAECIRKLCKQNDNEARDKLIVHNLRLVAHVSKKYSTCRIPQEDILSLGTVGLIKGINTFDPDKGSKFSSYVSKCIDNEILMAIRSENKASSNVYLEDVIGCDEEGNNILLSDVMSQEDEDITHKVDLESYSKKMEALFDTILSPREKTIIKMRYGIGQPRRYSQLEIAELLSISRSYVSRIEKKVIEKLAFEFGKKQHEVF